MAQHHTVAASPAISYTFAGGPSGGTLAAQHGPPNTRGIRATQCLSYTAPYHLIHKQALQDLPTSLRQRSECGATVVARAPCTSYANRYLPVSAATPSVAAGCHVPRFHSCRAQRDSVRVACAYSKDQGTRWTRWRSLAVCPTRSQHQSHKRQHALVQCPPMRHVAKRGASFDPLSMNTP